MSLGLKGEKGLILIIRKRLWAALLITHVIQNYAMQAEKGTFKELKARHAQKCLIKTKLACYDTVAEIAAARDNIHKRIAEFGEESRLTAQQKILLQDLNDKKKLLDDQFWIVDQFFLAVFDGDSQTTCGFLITTNINVNMKIDAGITPLHCATAKGFDNIITLLINHGANPDIPDEKGHTPYSLAQQTHQQAVIELFNKKRAISSTSVKRETANVPELISLISPQPTTTFGKSLALALAKIAPQSSNKCFPLHPLLPRTKDSIHRSNEEHKELIDQGPTQGNESLRKCVSLQQINNDKCP